MRQHTGDTLCVSLSQRTVAAITDDPSVSRSTQQMLSSYSCHHPIWATVFQGHRLLSPRGTIIFHIYIPSSGRIGRRVLWPRLKVAHTTSTTCHWPELSHMAPVKPQGSLGNVVFSSACDKNELGLMNTYHGLATPT